MSRILIIILCLSHGFAYSGVNTKNSYIQPIFDDKISQIIASHYHDYHNKEYFSAIQVTVKTQKNSKTYAYGFDSRESQSNPVNAQSLFNIGSITKSFTSALMLIAQKEHKINLSTKLMHYLDNYPNWSDLNLTTLLNMTSGLPNYGDTPKINYQFSKNLKKFWTKPELINLVYTRNVNPPLKKGYFYTNTGYILAAMILESRYGKPFADLIKNKIINALNLTNTYYPSPIYSSAVFARLTHGYSYNVYTNPELAGVDVRENNLSWAGAAGGLVANSQDVVKWVEALFIHHSILNEEQLMVMQKLISTNSGKPIKETSPQDPNGFGLGIIQKFDPEFGRFWFYQGETLGYRALYMYTPCNKIIISALFNSSVNSQNNHASLLLKAIYKKLLESNKQLVCRS